jgi:hypothetical protein
MLTTGSKLLLGGTVASTLAALVWGISNGGASAYVGVIGLLSVALAFGLLFGVNYFVRDCNVPATAPDALTASAAAMPPARRSAWPLVAAFGVGLIALGAVTKPIVFKAGILVVLAASIEWMVQAWSERASSDPAYNDSLRKRLLHPLEFPLLGAIGAAILVYSFSRIMLFLSKEGGPIAFILFGVLILGFATIFALQPTIKRGVVVGICAIAALGIVGAGAAMAISGQREIDRHPIVNDDDGAQCLRTEDQVAGNPEYEEIEHHSSQKVSAKSNPMARVVLESGQLRAYIVGADQPIDQLTVARSNPGNILFQNHDEGEFRLTAFAGTDVTKVNDTEVKVDRLTCTTLIRKDGEAMLTVNFPKSSAAAAPDAPYTLTVPGLEGQQITVVVP